jgi:hypothetical protein
VPMATPIARSLRRWAAVGLSTIMLLEIGFHLRRHESPVAAGILLLLAVFVVLGRFRVEVRRARNAALAAMLKTVAEALKNSASNHQAKKGAQIADSCS